MDSSTSLGRRLANLRRRRDLHQQQLADIADVSVDTIRKLEQGQRHSARLDTVNRLAEALDVPLAELLGVPSGLAPEQQTDVIELRAVIYDQVPDVNEPPTTADLRSTITELWGIYWAGRYTALAQVLPHKLTGARAVVRAAGTPAEILAANAVLAEFLQLAASLAAHLTYEDLSQVALLQATAAAEMADDPLLRAAQQSTSAWVLSRQGLWPQAERLAAAAAADIEPVLSRATPEQIAVWGELLHFGTIALARDKRVVEARELLGLVQAAGAAIGGRRPAYTCVLQFGPTFAGTSAVGTAVAVDQPREALRLAEQVDHIEMLPPSIHARFLLNVAYAQTVEWRSQEALDTLRRVEALTPELMQHHGLARTIVEELLPRRRTQRLPGLVKLAERLGVSTE